MMNESRVTVGGYFWVCVDCMLAHANGELPDDIPEGQPQPWSLWTDQDVAMGGEHADDCTARADGTDCDCETREFSWSQCEGCGSWLGGSRYAFVWFVPAESAPVALSVLFTVEWQSGAITRDIVPAADIPAHIAPYVAPDTLPTIATITITENEA